jgi:hypothetical protein
MPTIGGQVITYGDIRMQEQGDWFGDVRTNSGERIADGTRVDIVIENLTLSGAIVRGNITENVGRYQVAGRPEWGNTIRPRGYQSAASVLRKTVLSDIARETLGASWANIVQLPAAADLGAHYQRAGSFGDVEILARDALELLGVSWYVNNAGVTVFDTRPTGTVTTSETILVAYRNDAIGYRVVNCEDVAAFVPGLTFESETIGDVTYSITPKDVVMHVWTRAAATASFVWLRTLWRRAFPHVELQGFFSYTTVGPSQGGKYELRSVRSRHLPNIGSADAWSIAGHTSDLVAGTRVLVTFADGDPSQPVIVAIDPSTLPTSSTHEAVASVDIDATLVNLGVASAFVVVNNLAFSSWIGTVSAAAGVLAPLGYTSTKVKA